MRYITVLILFGIGTALAAQSFIWAACMFLWNNIFQPMGFAYSHDSLPVAKYVFWVLIISYIVNFARGILRPSMNLMIVMSTVFLAWLFVCTLYSPFQNVVWNEYMVIIKYTIPLMIISSGLTFYKDILLISATLMVSVGIWSSQGGVKGLLSGVTANMAIRYGQMSDNNDFMAAAVGILPMLLFFSMNYTGKYRIPVRGILYILSGLTMTAIVFSNSRGAVVGVLGLILFYLFVTSERKVRDTVILSVILIITSLLLPASFWERMGTIELSLDYQTEASATSRLHLMKSGIACIADHPIFGVGPNSWIYVSEQYSGLDSEPHSAYIKLAAESGLVGLGIFILFFGLTIWRLLIHRKRLKYNHNDEQAKFSLALALVLIGLAITFAFLNHPYSEFLWAWLGISNAFLTLANQQQQVSFFVA